jgi:methyl-accepting chemotaxis protein
MDYRGIQYQAIAGGSHTDLDALSTALAKRRQEIAASAQALAATAGELDALVRRFQLVS